MVHRGHTIEMLRHVNNVWACDPEIKRSDLVKTVKRYFDCSYSTANRVVKLAEERRDIFFDKQHA